MIIGALLMFFKIEKRLTAEAFIRENSSLDTIDYAGNKIMHLLIYPVTVSAQTVNNQIFAEMPHTRRLPRPLKR